MTNAYIITSEELQRGDYTYDACYRLWYQAGSFTGLSPDLVGEEGHCEQTFFEGCDYAEIEINNTLYPVPTWAVTICHGVS